MNVLAVIAHADDEILGCGATFRLLSDQGHRVVTCVLSRDAGAGHAKPELALLHEVTEKCASMDGIADSRRHSFKNIQLNAVPRPGAGEGDRAVDRRVRAEMGLYPPPGRPQRGPPSVLGSDDARGRAASAAVQLSAVALRKLFLFEVPSSTDWGHPAPFASFQPNANFDVTIHIMDIPRPEHLMQDLSYQEKQDRLATRIRAHKHFANFDIDEWIASFLARRRRRAIFDLGCGSGNHVHLYLDCVGPQGCVAGLDREEKLVDEARKRYSAAANLELRVGSMDDTLPFPDGSFDTCFSNFAIYNASDPSFTLRELKRVLQPGGEVVLIGPTINNAREIYEFNERLTGTAMNEIALIRTDRLRREVLPLALGIFADVREEVLNSQLEFPSAEEFLRYYTATMLYEEGAEKLGKTAAEMRAALGPGERFVLSKEMLAVVAADGYSPSR